MAKNSNPYGKPTSATASNAAPSSKPATYAVSKRLTTSEDEWLRQQKKQANETFRQSKSSASVHPTRHQAIEAARKQGGEVVLHHSDGRIVSHKPKNQS